MTLSGTRDTQEVLKALDELDIEVDQTEGPELYRKFGWEVRLFTFKLDYNYNPAN